MRGSETSKLLTRREAAEMLAVSVDTLVRLLDRGELRAVRIGRSVLVPLSEVQSFVDRQLNQSGDAQVQTGVES